jgi:acetyl coenzyme A synthetase (ADP forming)-like protein
VTPQPEVKKPESQVAYPAHREADVVLRDGSTVHVRPIRPADQERLYVFFRDLSERSRSFRFFSPTSEYFLSMEARREAEIDYVRAFGLVAVAGPEERIVAHAVYVVAAAERAEVALAIVDEFQGRGLGTILLGHLAEIAAANGVRVFEAEVLAENHRMVEVFRESGFPVEVRADAGLLHVTFPTSLTGEALERFEQRDRIAAVNALKTFFSPRSVAVIGASRQRGTIGGELFHNLLSYGFVGPVYPVNPSAEVVQSVPAYPSVEAVPGAVDLAVITVPVGQVTRVAEECAKKGVRALVVISAGFGEAGEEGRERQAELLRVCRAAGMRLIGPNCMGIANTDPAVRLNATFSPLAPPPGRVGFLSQSGALGLAIIDYAGSLGLGISTFVSVGNKADISSNDLLSYWESDPRTDVILLYIESFGNPRKFSRIARRVGRAKPIVAVKSGRSPAGARATSSHTGALIAASDITVDALFRQTGVIRTDTLEELFDVASLLAHQPIPSGRRVGIVTNAGGPGILCADACEAQGLAIPVLSDDSQARLRGFLPPQASVANPVDMIASATPEHYREAIRIVGADPNVDALVVVFIPPLLTRAEDVARAIVEGARELGGKKPVVTVFMSARGVPEELRRADVRVPSYAFPEAAAIALAHAARYGEWRRRRPAAPPKLEGLSRDEAAAIVSLALRRGDGWLPPEETRSLLSCYGLPVVEQRVAEDAERAGAAAEELGGEVALKAIAPGVVHKTELGGVRLRLRGADAVSAAAREMDAAFRAKGHTPTGFLIQRMIGEGAEMIVGVVHDRQFGPVVACGAGGVMVELLRDVSVRLAPLTGDDASEMIQSLRTYPLLTGFRGSPACDVGALQDALLRVSALVEDLPQIAELDLNPIMVHRTGAAVVDARVRVAPSAPPLPLGARG